MVDFPSSGARYEMNAQLCGFASPSGKKLAAMPPEASRFVTAMLERVEPLVALTRQRLPASAESDLHKARGLPSTNRVYSRRRVRKPPLRTHQHRETQEGWRDCVDYKHVTMRGSSSSSSSSSFTSSSDCFSSSSSSLSSSSDYSSLSSSPPPSSLTPLQKLVGGKNEKMIGFIEATAARRLLTSVVKDELHVTEVPRIRDS
jgi:hypothetical protein